MPVMLCTIILLFAASFASTGGTGGLLWDLLNGAGFAACALFVQLSWLSASPARQPMLDAHADLALWICGFAMLHGIGLIVAEPTLLEYLEADAPLYMLMGVLALVMLLALTWASFSGTPARVAELASLPQLAQWTWLSFSAPSHGTCSVPASTWIPRSRACSACGAPLCLWASGRSTPAARAPPAGPRDAASGMPLAGSRPFLYRDAHENSGPLRIIGILATACAARRLFRTASEEPLPHVRPCRPPGCELHRLSS